MCLIYLSDCPNPEGGCTLVTSRISGTGNIITLREKRVLKQYPWGTFATNGSLFSKGHSLSEKMLKSGGLSTYTEIFVFST